MKDKKSKTTNVSTIRYAGLKRFQNLADVFVWQRQVFKEDNSWNNDPVSDGMILSPYLTLKVNGQEFPVYAARATFSTHSFAYAEIEGEGDFSLSVELHLFQKRNVVTVLPESTGVKATVSGDFDVSATIDKFGSYSFVFDHYIESAFTLIVRKKPTLSLPNGYEIVEIPTGTHERQETTFDKENRVYLFKSGLHTIDCISLPSNSILYLEEGAILKAKYREDLPLDGVVISRHKKNVAVCGGGAFDYSDIPCGKRAAFDFFDCENIAVREVTLINSDTWTVCFTACKGILAEEIVAIAYRMFSDGIMLSDCSDGLVQNCFLRTGDDAAEIKSTSDTEKRTDNILFRNIAAWTDKACGYGIVYECNHDTQNVRFENCSIGFALPNWSEHLGCITVNTGNNQKSTDHNIYFKDIEIYSTYCSTVSICAYEGAIKDIYVQNVKVKYNYHQTPVLFWIRDTEKASIGKVYLDDIEVNNIPLTAETKDKIVGLDVPDGAFDGSDIIINSL